jgi:hypothetical protein
MIRLRPIIPAPRLQQNFLTLVPDAILSPLGKARNCLSAFL